MNHAQLVMEMVAKHFGCSVAELKARDRSPRLIRPRFTTIWFLSQMQGLSSTVIGRILGGRDHTTILNGLNRSEVMFQTDLEMAAAKQTLLSEHAKLFTAQSITKHMNNPQPIGVDHEHDAFIL